VIHEAEAVSRKQIFLICRYVLIFATGALAFVEIAKQVSPLPVTAVVAVALVSNMVLGQAAPFAFFDAWLQAPVLVADTAMISLALLLTRASQESFFFFFFVLIMAAKLENMVGLGIGAALIGLASFLLTTPDAGWAAPTLMRVPFMFATGIFFGYVVLPERTGQMSGLDRPASFSSSKQPSFLLPKQPLKGPRIKGPAAPQEAA
jgi:hypothetical protein